MAKLVTIVNMGDSITFGQYVDPNLRWTSLLHQHFDRRFFHTDIHVQCLNKGISGETTRMGLERFPADVQNQHPDIMTLEFGLNDCNCWFSDKGSPRVSEPAYEANLVEMIQRVRRFGCKHIVLSTNHPTLRRKPMISGEPYEDANARYSEIVRRVATHTGVTLCDIRKVFAPFSDQQLDEMLLPYPDHLHLSIKGNKVYADAILPFVEDFVNRVLAGYQATSSKAAA
jgi:lysophospholipase L1-like esterase